MGCSSDKPKLVDRLGYMLQTFHKTLLNSGPVYFYFALHSKVDASKNNYFWLEWGDLPFILVLMNGGSQIGHVCKSWFRLKIIIIFFIFIFLLPKILSVGTNPSWYARLKFRANSVSSNGLLFWQTKACWQARLHATNFSQNSSQIQQKT